MKYNAFFVLISGTALAAPVLANPVDGDYFDGPECDDFGDLVASEELGTDPVFPSDELIASDATFTDLSACSTTDDPDMANALVSITNLSGRDWTDLFYVGDAATRFSNVDGFATTNEALPPDSLLTLAFRIDSVGANKNLIFESGSFDGVFEVGETWQFIVQDFSNLFGLSAADMSSLDFAGGSLGDMFSAASIVQFRQVPAPGSIALFGLAGIAGARRRRA